MYSTILTIHSFVRWLVLAGLLFALYRSYSGLVAKRAFTSLDNKTRHWAATMAHIQLIFGIWLYFVSPIIKYFLNNFSETVSQRAYRFYGMEHSLMMLVAIIFITLGSSLAKRKKSDKLKFKTMAIWYTIALIIILVNIPWPFSPMGSRPWLRYF